MKCSDCGRKVEKKGLLALCEPCFAIGTFLEKARELREEYEQLLAREDLTKQEQQKIAKGFGHLADN